MDNHERIWLSPPYLDAKTYEYVESALASNWVAPAGPHLVAFEKALQAFCGSAGVLAVNSGTAALHLAYRLAGINTDDEVLCPTFTYVATASPLIYLGAQPVFIDTLANDYSLDPNIVEDALLARRKAGKKIRALIIAHLYGSVAEMNPFLVLAEKYDLVLIEDAAEALGASWNRRAAGTIGNYGAYSFNGNKIVTTSGGGALLSNTALDIELARSWAAHSKENSQHFEHHAIGYNYTLSNICAAIGLAQLEILNEKLARRKNINTAYQMRLAHLVPEIYFISPKPNTSYSNWLTTIHFRSIKKLEKVFTQLLQHNIDVRRFWKPLHLQSPFQGLLYFGSSHAYNLWQAGLCLPSGESLTMDQIDRITQIICACF